MAGVLLTGGTGLIGTHLCRKLLERGFDVAVLSRFAKPDGPVPVLHWNYESGEIDEEALNYTDFIIHLAGANIGEKRWTERRKKQIIDSRVQSAEFLFETITGMGIKPKAFISASGIGYYGALTEDRIFVEEDENQNDFVGRTCYLWEEAADIFQDEGIRTVKLRTGIVMTSKGGAMARIIASLKFRTAAILGNGNQYFPWIHIDDLCNIYIKALEDSKMSGAYNAAAPQHLTYRQLVRHLGGTFKKPLITIRVPKPALKLVFGELSQILLEGSRISSQKLIDAGYRFEFSSIESTLADLFIKKPMI